MGEVALARRGGSKYKALPFTGYALGDIDEKSPVNCGLMTERIYPVTVGDFPENGPSVWGGFSGNGRYFARAHNNRREPISVFEVVNGEFIRLQVVINDYATYAINKAAFSYDGTYLATFLSQFPWIIIYKRTDNVYSVKFAGGIFNHDYSVLSGDFSPDGKYFAYVYGSSPYLKVWDCSVPDVFTAVSVDSPMQTPTSSWNTCKFSPDSTRFAVGCNQAPYINTYGVTSGGFVKEPLMLTGRPSSNVLSLAWSPDSQRIVCGSGSSPYLAHYKYIDNTLTFINNLTKANAQPYACAFSVCGNFLAVTTEGGGNYSALYFYKLIDDVFEPFWSEAHNNSDMLARWCAFSPDGRYVCMGGYGPANTGMPWYRFFKAPMRPSGKCFARILEMEPAPFGWGNNGVCAFSPDGNNFAVASDATKRITVFRVNGSKFTELAALNVIPGNTILGLAFSPDSENLVATCNASPFVLIYYRINNTYAKVANPPVLPSSIARCPAWSSDSTNFAIIVDYTPFVFIYRRDALDSFSKLSNLSPLPTLDPATSCLYFRRPGYPTTDYLTVVGSASSGSPIMYRYLRTDGSLTYSSTTAPTGIPTASRTVFEYCSASYDGRYFVGIKDLVTSRPLVIKTETNGVAAVISNAILQGINGGCSAVFSPDSRFLALMPGSNYSYFWLFERFGDTFISITGSNPVYSPVGGNVDMVAFSPDNQLLVVVEKATINYVNKTRVRVYKLGNFIIEQTRTGRNIDILDAAFGVGYSKDAISDKSTGTIDILIPLNKGGVINEVLYST